MKRILLASVALALISFLSACTTTTFSQQLPPGQRIAVVSALGDNVDFVDQPYFGRSKICSRNLSCLNMDKTISRTIAARLRSTDCYEVTTLQLPNSCALDSNLTPAAKETLRQLIQGKNICKILLVTPDCMRSDPVTRTGDQGPVGYGYECATMPGNIKCAALYAGYCINIIDAYSMKVISSRCGHVVIPKVSCYLCLANPQDVSEQYLVQLFYPLKCQVVETVKVNIEDKKLYYR